MPTSIPYDPSLILGNIVSLPKLQNIEAIAMEQAPINAAEDELNSFIALKRSIDMTIQEVSEMGVATQELQKESTKVGTSIQKAAINYAATKIAGEQKIQPLRAKISMVNASVESPIDYNKSQLKKMPLAADSLSMNCQFFTFDKNTQTSSSQAQTISTYISGSFTQGDKDDPTRSMSASMSGSMQRQVHQQYEAHDITGTLVLSINCTHKEAQIFAPYVLDIDKAVRVWNAEYPSEKLDVLSVGSMMEALVMKDQKNTQAINLLSGATFGSSFVGMVHVLNTESTVSMQKMNSMAASIQAQFTASQVAQSEAGGFGLDGSMSQSAKNLLSQHQVQSHCTLNVMGSIPSIRASNLDYAVKGFQKFDGEQAMNDLAKLQNATAGEQNSLEEKAAQARAGKSMEAMKVAAIQPTLSAVADIDSQHNKMLDIDSMMGAMQDYIDKCLAGNIGIPINYYLKPITKAEIAGAWIKKYYPSKYTVQFSSGDDSENNKQPVTSSTSKSN